MTIISLIIIAIALSMDTFSLSLSLTLLSNSFHLQTLFIITVGILHFSFPLIGSNIGNNILKFIYISPNKLLGIIFIILFLKLLYDILHTKKEIININIIYIIILSVLVSIDSFITGIGLTSTIKYSLLPSIIFAITSAFFTFLGLLIGKKAHKNLGEKADKIGLILLLILGIVHLCK